MKDKIIIFIVGLLLGSIISTASIYIYTIANNKNSNNDIRMELPNKDKDMMNDKNMTNPPEMPNNKNEK